MNYAEQHVQEAWSRKSMDQVARDHHKYQTEKLAELRQLASDDLTEAIGRPCARFILFTIDITLKVWKKVRV